MEGHAADNAGLLFNISNVHKTNFVTLAWGKCICVSIFYLYPSLDLPDADSQSRPHEMQAVLLNGNQAVRTVKCIIDEERLWRCNTQGSSNHCLSWMKTYTDQVAFCVDSSHVELILSSAPSLQSQHHSRGCEHSVFVQ